MLNLSAHLVASPFVVTGFGVGEMSVTAEGVTSSRVHWTFTAPDVLFASSRCARAKAKVPLVARGMSRLKVPFSHRSSSVSSPVTSSVAPLSHEPAMVTASAPEPWGFGLGAVSTMAAGAVASRSHVVEVAGPTLPARSTWWTA